MIRVVSFLVLISSLTVVSVLAEPYGFAREKARNNMDQSSVLVEKMYEDIRILMKKYDISGDKDHDEFAVNLFEESFLSWKKLRSAECYLKAQLEVYPSESRFYQQTYNVCVWEKNKNYMKYLQDLKITLNEEHE